jgi:hypothetical protein
MHDLVLYAEMTDRQPAEVCSITCEEDRSSLPMNRMTLPLLPAVLSPRANFRGSQLRPILYQINI